MRRCSRRTNSKVGVDAGVTGSARKVFVLLIRNVQVRPWVAVLLCQTEINHIHLMAALRGSHEEIIRFDISMDEVLGMDILDSGYLPKTKERDWREVGDEAIKQ